MTDFNKILEELKVLIHVGNEIKILEQLARLHPADVADVIEQLDDDIKTRMFGLLDIKTASDVIAELDEISRELIIEETPSEKLSLIVDEMDTDDAADLIADIADVSKEEAETVLKQISPEHQEEIQQLLEYDEESAGGIMQMELISVHQEDSVKNVIEIIRENREEAESIHNLFVVEDDDHLIGIVPLWEILLGAPDSKVKELMKPAEIIANVNMDQEEVAKIFAKYDIISLPVVDDTEKLLGRITIDDIVDVLDEEASEDIYHIAGAGDEEDILSRSLIDNLKARVPWLMFSLLAGLVMMSIIHHYNGMIEQIVALAVFFPVVMASGGNVALQSSVIGVRGLATGAITPFDLTRNVIREVRVAIGLSLLYVIVLGCLVLILFPDFSRILLSVCLSLAIIILMAATIGISIPIMFKRINVDPAVSTSPMVTSLMDIIGLFIYFVIAKIILF